MAKKGGVQQLQVEINTDEELAKFLDKDGLIIMDVYTEWCGPCLAMVGSLKKIKLEKGGDDLQLAVVKCDQIETLKRFRNKCEPTWLFVSKQKIVNCAYGSNVPKLMSMIAEELDLERKCRDGQAERIYYELTEMCSVELERFNAKKAQDEEIDKIEKEAAEAKRRGYITFVTDEIMKHGVDMGVTINMPHLITRDLFKRMTEQGDKFGLQAKDKKNALISDDDLEVLHFELDNPLPAYVLKLLKKKEAFFICWKAGEFEERPITTILLEMTKLLVEDQPLPDDENARKPALLKHHSIILTEEELTELGMKDHLSENAITCEITEEEEFADEAEDDRDAKAKELDNGECNHDVDQVQDIGDATNETDDCKDEPETGEHEGNCEEMGEIKIDDDGGGENDNVEESKNESEPPIDTESNENLIETESKTDDQTVEVEPINEIEKPKETGKQNEIKSKPLTRPISGHKFKIPAMWTPANPRANAAFIYIFFRHLTESFLPPDPIPVPPHVAVGFDAYKRKEIMDIIEQNGDAAILAYGYFSSDDIPNATLIANSTFKYNLETPTINDKLFVKVAKKIGNALANLIEMTPCHLSQNSEIGFEECLILFPAGYKNASETGVEPKEPEEEIESKKKKRKKGKKNKGEEKEEGDARDANAEDGADDDGDDDDDDDESELDDENVDECND